MASPDPSTTVEPWLSRFAYTINALTRKPDVRKRFQKALATWEAKYRDRPHPFAWRTGARVSLSDDGPALPLAERINQNRPLAKHLEPRDCVPDLTEKYVVLAAVHDHACRTSEPIGSHARDLKQDRAHWRYHLMVTEHVPTLTEADLPHLENCLAGVAADASPDRAEKHDQRRLPGQGVPRDETNRLVSKWMKKNVGEGKRYQPDEVRIRQIAADTGRPTSSIGQTRAWQTFETRRKQERGKKPRFHRLTKRRDGMVARKRCKTQLDAAAEREQREVELRAAAEFDRLKEEQAKDMNSRYIHLND